LRVKRADPMTVKGWKSFFGSFDFGSRHLNGEASIRVYKSDSRNCVDSNGILFHDKDQVLVAHGDEVCCL